jgi:hypothetical protein
MTFFSFCFRSERFPRKYVEKLNNSSTYSKNFYRNRITLNFGKFPLNLYFFHSLILNVEMNFQSLHFEVKIRITERKRTTAVANNGK